MAEWAETVELSEIPQALSDVELRIAAAEELIAAIEANIEHHQRLLDSLRVEYRRAVSRMAQKYLERLGNAQ